MPLLSLNRVTHAYGHIPLLQTAQFQLDPGERVGLIGRNGSGKSTLLKILEGSIQPDDGQVWRSPGLRLSHVPQEPEFVAGLTIAEAVAMGLESSQEWHENHRVTALLDHIGLTPEPLIESLSGGEKKRVAIARALVGEPEVLILDEPTNHLDIAGIEWLERQLIGFPGAVVLVTHDRRFLDQVATRIIELDRGQLSHFGATFSEYQRRKAEALNAESLERARFDKLLTQEEAWIRQGVEARRTRNEGRVRRLEQLRLEREARRERVGQVRLSLDAGERSGELVAELQDVTVKYQQRTLIRSFSTRIQRGDKIGVIGPNGSGKTTLLQVILGRQAPDTGQIRLGTRLNVAYFDQWRVQLDPDKTLIETISPGSDFIEIQGQRKHAISYLGDFLFPPERARAKVASLSGGERNRLLLARLFAQPCNILVLDEPTNDLDMETLELLEALLADYSGTLFLVSHDRAFIDQVVNQVIVLEGEGKVTENAGGYSDWARHVAQRSPSRPSSAQSSTQAPVVKPSAPVRDKRRPEKMSFKEQRELEELPGRIEALETEQAELALSLGTPELYRSDPTAIRTLQARQTALEQELQDAMADWEALLQKQDRLAQ